MDNSNQINWPKGKWTEEPAGAGSLSAFTGFIDFVSSWNDLRLPLANSNKWTKKLKRTKKW